MSGLNDVAAEACTFQASNESVTPGPSRSLAGREDQMQAAQGLLALSCPTSDQPGVRHDNVSPVIHKIEAVIEPMIDVLLSKECSPLVIALRSAGKVSRKRTTDRNTDSANYEPKEHQGTKICFPGKTPEEAWKFSADVHSLLHYHH